MPGSFGPRPRVVSKKINKKERRLAILSALYLKKKEFLFVEDSVFNNPIAFFFLSEFSRNIFVSMTDKI